MGRTWLSIWRAKRFKKKSPPGIFKKSPRDFRLREFSNFWKLRIWNRQGIKCYLGTAHYFYNLQSLNAVWLEDSSRRIKYLQETQWRVSGCASWCIWFVLGFVPFQLRNVTASHPIFTYHPRIPGTSVAEDYNGSSDPVGFLWEISDKNRLSIHKVLISTHDSWCQCIK